MSLKSEESDSKK